MQHSLYYGFGRAILPRPVPVTHSGFACPAKYGQSFIFPLAGPYFPAGSKVVHWDRIST